MSETMLSEQIEMLRVQLETSLPTPVVLVVSSARDDDGKNLVASGLARSMESAGYSTLLVLADERTGGALGTLEPKSLDEVVALGIARYSTGRSPRANMSVMVLPSGNIRHTVSRESVVRFSELCRSSYQVTIVETPAALANSFAMLSAIAADGVLLTIREGRRVRGSDRQLAKTLARERAPFLGVVSVAAALIRNEPASVLPNRATKTAPISTVKGDTGRERQAV
jgi:succinoglycan biosynthesis transport protein ExoP